MIACVPRFCVRSTACAAETEMKIIARYDDFESGEWMARSKRG